MAWAIDPDHGYESGGNTVTITLDTDETGPMDQGTWDASWQLKVDGSLVLDVTVVDTDTITYEAPAHAVGLVSVDVVLNID